MKHHEVTCVTKPNRFSSHEHITYIGGYGWYITVNEAIQRIESQTDAFYIVNKITGERSYISVVRRFLSPPYIRARANDSWNDNLLSLAECRL